MDKNNVIGKKDLAKLISDTNRISHFLPQSYHLIYLLNIKLNFNIVVGFICLTDIET